MTDNNTQADGCLSRLTAELDTIEVKNRILLAIKQADLLIEQWQKDSALTWEQMNTIVYSAKRANFESLPFRSNLALEVLHS